MNVYYDPEKFDLKIIGEIDKGGGYDFDIFVVFQKSNGDVVYATDSGCSCPTPFEGIGLNDLKPYSDEALKKWEDEEEDYYKASPTELMELKKKVRKALGGKK